MDTLNPVHLTYTDPSTGNLYAFFEHQDIHRCNEISGYTEVSDKETCKTVGNQFKQQLFSNSTSGWGLWRNGDTSVPNLPIGCSIATVGDNVYSSNGDQIHYQLLNDPVVGSTYNFTNANKICQKIIASSPTEATDETPTEAPDETPTEAPDETPDETPTEAPDEETKDDNDDDSNDDDSNDDETMYLWLGAGGVLLCLMILLILLMISK
jgi:hypothetical protein